MTKETSQRVWDSVMKIIVAVLLAGGGYTVAGVTDHETRISVIESNRFTNGDATALEKNIMDRLPPDWLREDMREIKETLKAMDRRLDSLEKQN